MTHQNQPHGVVMVSELSDELVVLIRAHFMPAEGYYAQVLSPLKAIMNGNDGKGNDIKVTVEVTPVDEEVLHYTAVDEVDGGGDAYEAAEDAIANNADRDELPITCLSRDCISTEEINDEILCSDDN